MSTGRSGSTETWTTRRLLEWTAKYLGQHGVDQPRLSTEMLLAHVLGVERLKLYMDPDRPASELERAAFRGLVERAVQHEPVDYLVGQAPFFSMMLTVNPSVLVPRPSTETVVEHVVQHARRTPGFHSPSIVDIGTGSGAIAIALAKHVPGCHVTATDVSDAALEVAKQNAAEQGVADRVEFLQGDLYEPIAGRRFRYIVSNPPYISDAEWEDVAPNVQDHEPTGALRGGADGLRYLRPLIAEARGHADGHAQLVLEIAASQKQQVLRLADEAPGLTHAHVLADHEALPRVLVADVG